MVIELIDNDFKVVKDAVITGVWLNYFDQQYRNVPAVVLTLLKNLQPYSLELWNVDRFTCNCDCSTQKWIKNVLYESGGKVRIRIYTIFQVVEYDDIILSEIVAVGRNIELKLVEGIGG